MAAELFKMVTAIDLTHVPYKGLSPALTDLLGGQIQLMFSSTVAMLPQIRAGKLRALAMTGARRSPAAPEIPTVAEAGFAGCVTSSWYGVLAPARTPAPILERLNREIAAAIKLPEIRDRLASEGAEAAGGSPAEFAAHIKSELARWAQVIKTAKIKAD